MAKTFALSIGRWHKLQEKILEDHGRATLMISWRLKATLGFTVREHYWYDHVDGFMDKFADIRLDFWDDQMQTMFLLKYSDFLSANDVA